MKTFHCSACQALVFFENTRCLNCTRVLAFAPDQMTMLALEPAEGDAWLPLGAETPAPEPYRLCTNYSAHGVCNWVIPNAAPETLCQSCTLTLTIPNLSVAGNLEAWAKLETAKRRMVYALLSLQLPVMDKRHDAEHGLEFHFKSDSVDVNGDQGRVLTGHDNGVITINVAEADDVHRESLRVRQHEPYRTLLGHFRHEIGHYYWDQLVAPSARIDQFRSLFGDERADYQEALVKHYEHGAPAGWEENFISAYATMHPWEDWAESWAHVMHMVDALETAQAVGLSVKPPRRDEPALSIPKKPPSARIEDFDALLDKWLALTYVLNNLTRGLGLADAYPFAISARVAEKLRFVCQAMSESDSAPLATTEPPSVAAPAPAATV